MRNSCMLHVSSLPLGARFVCTTRSPRNVWRGKRKRSRQVGAYSGAAAVHRIFPAIWLLADWYSTRMWRDVCASRGQLVRQLLVESMVLSIAGGVAGVLLAVAMTRGLLALVPTEGNPLLIHAQPDLRILSFTLGLTFLTGLIFGLVPAMRASHPDLWTTLKDAVGSIAGSGGSLFLRKGLVGAGGGL